MRQPVDDIASHPDPIIDQYQAIATGDPDIAIRAVAIDWTNREASGEPPAARVGGPVGLAVTVAWLRSAFSEIAFEELERVTERDTVVSRVRMTGRQTGPLVLFDGDRPAVVFPPTGRRFAIEQIHVHRLREGEVIGHLARRDDLGMMQQLGHVPPTPAVMARMLWWRLTGRGRRSGFDAIALADNAAEAMRVRMGSDSDGVSIEAQRRVAHPTEGQT